MVLPEPRLYFIADPSRCPPGHFLSRLQAVIDAGVSWVQLRAKGLAAQESRALAAQALAITRPAGARLLLNGDPAQVAALGADGLQLSAAQLAHLAGQRRQADWGLLGASCHDAAELAAAAAVGCDFALLSPVFPTATHPGAPALGLERFAGLVRQAALPVLALGGITPARATAALAHGAAGVAVLGGILEAPDQREAVTAYLAALASAS